MYFSNGPVTGYRIYTGDDDSVIIQGASNANATLALTGGVEISVSVVAINSAGESAPTTRMISLNSKFDNYKTAWNLSLSFQLPREHCVHLC